MKNGIFDLAGDSVPEPSQTPPTGPRVYSPGFRPWVSGMNMHLPNDEGWSGLGADPNTVTDKQAITVLAILGGFGLAAMAVYSVMGYYVGKRLGTRWGWFWGMGGPVGLAAMAGYRQMKGRASPDGSATPNRRRGRRRARRRSSC